MVLNVVGSNPTSHPSTNKTFLSITERNVFLYPFRRTILCHIGPAKHIIKVTWQKLFNIFSTSRNWLPMADYFCVSMIQSRCPQVACLQPFALAVAKRTRLPCHCPCARMRHNHLCLISSKDFNIMSTLSVHQSLTLPQKIDSREGLF